MTKDEKKEWKELFIEAFISNEARSLIKEGTLEALKSKDGQDAIVSALKSDSGRDAIIGSLSTEKAKETLTEFFMEAFNDVILPGVDNLQADVNIIKEDISGMAIDLKYFKEKEARTEKYVQDLREKVFRRKTT